MPPVSVITLCAFTGSVGDGVVAYLHSFLSPDMKYHTQYIESKHSDLSSARQFPNLTGSAVGFGVGVGLGVGLVVGVDVENGVCRATFCAQYRVKGNEINVCILNDIIWTPVARLTGEDAGSSVVGSSVVG